MSLLDNLDTDRANFLAVFGESSEWTCTPATGDAFTAEVAFRDDGTVETTFDDAVDQVRTGRLYVNSDDYATPDDRDTWTDPDGTVWAVTEIGTRSSYLLHLSVRAIVRRAQGRGRRMNR